MLSKVKTILDDTSHPLHDALHGRRSTFSNTHIPPRCSTGSRSIILVRSLIQVMHKRILVTLKLNKSVINPCASISQHQHTRDCPGCKRLSACRGLTSIFKIKDDSREFWMFLEPFFTCRQLSEPQTLSAANTVSKHTFPPSIPSDGK